MTKSIQKIKQDLENLESKVAEAADELQNLYGNYLDSLSKSVKQQLILASYQLCTQIYPESFLRLSLNNKQKLQQQIRAIAKKIEPILLESIELKELQLEPTELSLVAEMIKNLPLSPNKEKIVDLSQLELVQTNLENLDTDLQETSAAEAGDEENNSEPQPTPQKQAIDFNNPEHLILWHKQVERTIKKTLDRTSKEINKYLQEAEVIPSRLPNKILEVAIQSESASSLGTHHKAQNIPNVLNLMIEMDKEKKSKPTSIAQISLLRLRLSEIEFYDPLLNAKRSQIGILMNKISKLKHRYQAINQEYSVAEAQAAWRSIWYED